MNESDNAPAEASAPRTWSWAHRGSVRPRVAEGLTYACACHRDEEQTIAASVEQLRDVASAIVRYSAVQHPHGLQADAYVAGTVRAYFRKGLVAVSVGRGFRGSGAGKVPAELDVVVDDTVAAWVGEAREDVGVVPVLAHLEVAYRRSYDRRKVREDHERVRTTIVSALSSVPARKTWTGLVLAGDGWRGRAKDVLEDLVAIHRKAPPAISTAASGPVWTFIDFVALPGAALLKHDLFEAPTRSASKWPALALLPTLSADDPMQPVRSLAVARWFFHRFLRDHMKRDIVDTPALESAAVLGPVPSRFDGTRTPVLFGVLDPRAPTQLWYLNGDNFVPANLLPARERVLRGV